ncbi:MAG: hypothetical protein KF799_04840 [Bdellovibrionales bacterium]|nr:hypothetical protein [Bdellovibrionales bacterium]
MSQRVLALALTGAVLILLTFSFVHMVRASASDNAKFEGKVNAGRAFMYVARSLNMPAKCSTALVPLLKEWNRQSAQNFTYLDTKVQLRPRQIGDVSVRPSAELVVLSEYGERALPLHLAIGPTGEIIGCAVDEHAVRYMLGSAIYASDKCFEPARTTQWFVRCPATTFLNRDVVRGTFWCCPLRGG